METGLQLGSDLLQVGSQMMDLTWSNKDPSNKAVSIFETVIYQLYFCYFNHFEYNQALYISKEIIINMQNNRILM